MWLFGLKPVFNGLFFVFFIVLMACNKPSPTAIIGNQIKMARQQKQMTEDELAKAVGIDKETLRLIESGVATPIQSKKADLERVLGIVIDF